MAVALSYVLCTLVSAGACEASQGPSPWLEYEQARQVARKSAKPIFLVFR